MRPRGRGCHSSDAPFFPWPQGVAETDQPVSDSGFCGADRQIEHGRHLYVCVAAEVGQLQGFALYVGQRVQCCSHPSRLECCGGRLGGLRSEEHTSELQSLMRISYAVFCLKKKNTEHT